MAIYGVSNQLLQIDTGKASTYLYNKALSPVAIYADIGEAQVLGQRYFSVDNTSATNPQGSQSIYMLVKYLATSALTTANLTTAAAPLPVFWTDNTFSTVTAISTEGFMGLNGIAGFLRISTTAVPTLTAAQVLGAQLLVQVGGYLAGAYVGAGGAGTVAGDALIGAAGAAVGATRVAAGTAPGYRVLGYATSAVAANLVNTYLTCDIV